jgi:hypothetical protein
MKPTLILNCEAFGLALCFASQAQAQNTVGAASTRSGGGFTNVIVNGANFSTIGGGYSNAVSTAATFAAGSGRASDHPRLQCQRLSRPQRQQCQDGHRAGQCPRGPAEGRGLVRHLM